VYVNIEGLCYLGLNALRAKGIEYDPLPSALSQEQKNLISARFEDAPPLRGHHPMLGWTPKPNSLSKDVKINSQGIRSTQDYSRDVDPKRVRLSAFGDSFTFGSEVDNTATWEFQLEEQDARFEVLNFGVGAYGLDQAYLRYVQDGVDFQPDIVVIGFMSENIFRNLNVFRPFYSSMYQTSIYTKPRFSIENGNLLLLKNPLTTVDDYRRFVNDDEAMLREIGNKDYFYQAGYLAGPLDGLPSVRLLKVAIRSVKERLNPVVTREGSYDVSSEAFTLTTKLIGEFHCAALQYEALPVIVIYPDPGDFARYHSHQQRRYEPLREHLQSQGYRYLDMLDAFVAHDPHVPVDRLTIGQWGHYSQLGNEIVAKHFQRYMNDQGLVSRDVVKTLARAAREKQHCRPNAMPEISAELRMSQGG
jgi:hypothetical protein